MSSNLKTITGQIELIPASSNDTKYLKSHLCLTRFSGGKERGLSLQLGFYDENHNYRHIQLDNKAVKILLTELSENFKYEEI